MALEFHFTDTPPQTYLDELHSIDVPKLFDPLLQKQQRDNLVVLIKKRLDEWRKKIQTQIKTIHERTASDPDQATLLIAPYQKLAELGNDLNKAITELERAMRGGRVIPPGFKYGSHIFGDLKRGEWHLGERDDVRLWDDYSKLRTRMEAIGKEYKTLLQQVKLSQARVLQQQDDLKRMTRMYKRQRNPFFIMLRLLPVLLVTILALMGGWYAYRSEVPLSYTLSNPVIGGIGMVIGTAAAILMLVIARRRTKEIKQLKTDIANGKRALTELKALFKQARIDFYPTDALYKELRKEYKLLKAAFSCKDGVTLKTTESNRDLHA